MMIKLYHGSNVRVEKPDLHKSKPYKDFGQGFYLSDDKQQAWDIAYSKVAQLKTGKAMVSTFLFDEQQIEIMKDELSVELADWLMDTYNYSAAEALDVLYTSETYDRLQDSSTGFYYQSLGYVASFLQNEVERAVFC